MHAPKMLSKKILAVKVVVYGNLEARRRGTLVAAPES
jgi:hypothetical protein